MDSIGRRRESVDCTVEVWSTSVRLLIMLDAGVGLASGCCFACGDVGVAVDFGCESHVKDQEGKCRCGEVGI